MWSNIVVEVIVGGVVKSVGLEVEVSIIVVVLVNVVEAVALEVVVSILVVVRVVIEVIFGE